MSKTERDLSSERDVDALDDLFTDDEFERSDPDTDIGDHDAFGPDAFDDHADADANDADDDVDAHTVIVVHPGEELDDESDVDETDVDTIDAIDDRPAALEGADDELPEIIPATPDHEALTTIEHPVLDRDDDTEDADTEDDDTDDVSETILEELRRADIDGPVVAYAPQDDTTSSVRRPRRAADYDPAPVPIPARVPRVLGRRPRVRKVTRVVRHVDPWSVFKIAILAHLVLYVIVLTASVLLWNVANATGTVDNVERFFESFGWNSFEFNGGELYHAGWIAGLFVVIGMTGLAILAATLFNLITDLVGGVRLTVLEEEVVETRTSPMRRFVVRRPEPEVPALLHDSSGPMYREAVVDDTGANQRPTR